MVFSHQGKHHLPIETEKQKSQEAPDNRFKNINESYLASVKPIFQKSCFDCYSQTPRLPWYHRIPFVHEYIESDIAEAKKHFDFTNDFPFAGHGSPEEDFKAIRDSIKNQSMPPFRYRMMHPGVGLCENERKIILEWIDHGERILVEKK